MKPPMWWVFALMAAVAVVAVGMEMLGVRP